MRVSDLKFKNFISKFLNIQGKGLPSYMIARKNNVPIDYIYYDDVNEIVDRLRLLIASKSAGNNNHTNEIMSILEELREANVIF